MKRFFIGLLLLKSVEIFAQNCEQNTANIFQPTNRIAFIDWKKFPDFSLPFTNIFGGPRWEDIRETLPLSRGFSHISLYSANENERLPAKNRAFLWYHVGDASMTVQTPLQPLELIESPWNNSAVVYENHWKSQLKSFANQFPDTQAKQTPNVDIFCLDIERDIATNVGILRLKYNLQLPDSLNKFVPSSYKKLADAAFLNRYKLDIQNFYATPILLAKQLGLPSTTKIASYSDVPVRNTFVNIVGNSWADWQANTDRIDYKLKDSLANTVGGSYYEQLNILTPSAYYSYDYPHPFAGQYLAYLLFQIEANKAWSNKDIIPFIWLRYNCSGCNFKFIKPFMAEATAIFPYFSGAKGLWLWEQVFNDKENYAVYEHFINGLYRLSKFKDMFEGDYQLFIPKSARDSFEGQEPIWRGIIKGNQLLVAAHNPFASDTQLTEMLLQVGNWEKKISLKGTEIFLCKYDIPTTIQDFLNLTVFPNPNQERILLAGKFTQGTDNRN